MVNWYLGSMGFSYSDWNGPFYPQNLAASNYLPYFSRFFNAVELDTTFYGTPRSSTIERWYATTEDDFMFTAKLPRQITHEKGLANAHVELHEFMTAVSGLKEKLGAVLIQLAPSYDVENTQNLIDFLDILPNDTRFAIEFRHASWFTSHTLDLLIERQICWASTEFPGYAPPEIYWTTDWLYIRWIGLHGRFDQFDEIQIDVTQNLRSWNKKISQLADQVSTVFGFFNNDYSGFSPATINAFKEMIGVRPKDFRPPQQPNLF